MPATIRRVFGPQLTLVSLSDVKEYLPGGRDPMALVARQSGSGLFLHASLPEIAHAIVFPLSCGSSAMTKSRPVFIVYPKRKLFNDSGTLCTTSAKGLQISPSVSFLSYLRCWIVT